MQNARMFLSRRKFLGNLGAAFAASAGTSVASVTYTSHFDSLQITQYDLSTDKVPEGFDHVAAHITDIHAGTPSVSKKKLAQIVTQVNGLTYQKKDGQRLPVDLIGIGGDILINKHYDPRTEFFHPEEIAPILGKLEAPLGVYGCLGNHDWDRMGHVLQIRHDDLTMDIWDIFKDNNIHLHENEIVPLNKDGMEFDLAILPDYKTRWNKHFDSTILKDVDKRPTIVLSHDPITFQDMPSAIVAQISGHTHGGQIVVPIIDKPLYLPTPNMPSHYAYGHIRENGRDMFVSSGIGTSTFDAKNTRNEVVLLRIRHSALLA